MTTTMTTPYATTIVRLLDAVTKLPTTDSELATALANSPEGLDLRLDAIERAFDEVATVLRAAIDRALSPARLEAEEARLRARLAEVEQLRQHSHDRRPERVRESDDGRRERNREHGELLANARRSVSALEKAARA